MLGFNVWIVIDLALGVGMKIDFGFVSGPKMSWSGDRVTWFMVWVVQVYLVLVCEPKIT